MASMQRNVDLEEIESDAPLGLDFLKYQTPFQKIWLISMIFTGVGLMLLGTFVLKININICVVFVFVPLLFGILFGANYNQDFSVFQYIVHTLKKSSVKYVFDSTESEIGLKKLKEHEALADKNDDVDGFDSYMKGVKKRIIIICIVIGIIMASLIVFKAYKTKSEETVQHHVACITDSVKNVTVSI